MRSARRDVQIQFPPAVTRQRIITAAAHMVKTRGVSRFGMRALADELGCQPAALYHHIQSKEQLLEAVAGLAEERLTGAMFNAATSFDERAQDNVRQAVDTFLRFASEDPNSWELLFLHPATVSVGQRARVTLERRLASLMDSGERTAENHANTLTSAKLTMTVAMGEAIIRVCRPGLTGCELSGAQIVELCRQRTLQR